MKRFAILGLFLASFAVAGECADCGGRQGLLARRAERRASRSSSASASCATASMETVQPAEIRTTTTYKTVKAGEKVVIVPTGAAQTVAPKGGK